MEIAVGVLAATLFFLGVLAGIRASDWLLKARERRLSDQRRVLNEQSRPDDDSRRSRVYLVVDPGAQDGEPDPRDGD